MDRRAVQNLAKQTMLYTKANIYPGMQLAEVRELCENKMLELGADSFWYWDVGAFVFSGDETALSVSGMNYVTSDRLIAENDIITIDLSPQCEGLWGDHARTLVLQNGLVVDDESIANTEWRNGIGAEKQLHDEMCRFVTPDTTFEELYFYMNGLIKRMGYINLDFLGNLGHSIVSRKEERVYIEKGNDTRLGAVQCFTFEPHIALPSSKYGFKREDIYFFESGEVTKL